MDAGLLTLTQAALLDQLDRDEPVPALHRLVADVAKGIARPCGLVALGPDGQHRWRTGVLPDEATAPAVPLHGRTEPFVELGFCWLPLSRQGEVLGAWLLPEREAGPPAEAARQLQPVLEAAGALLLCERRRAEARPAAGPQVGRPEPRTAPGTVAEATVRLNTLAAQVPGMLFQYRRRVDDLGSFPYVSERSLALVGETAQALLEDASRFFRRVDFADRGPLLDSVAESERTMEPWQYRFRLHHRDGTLRWMRGAATPLLEADGGLLWHGYLEDVTESMTIEQLQQQRAAAEAANRAKTEFLSRMSHELRTPLNAVLGFAQLMEVDSSQPLSDDQRRRVGLIRESGDHLLAMINDLLDLTSIEAGRVTLVPEPLVLDALLDDCLSMVRAGAQRDDVQLLHSPAPGLMLTADRKRMRQVLLNLLSNAIKYNRPGGQVRVGARRTEGELVLEVSDTGIGLTEPEIDQLFQPFNRLSQARSGIEGTGIGLAVTHALVTLMGGRIAVRSAPGRGSTFAVHLPVS